MLDLLNLMENEFVDSLMTLLQSPFSITKRMSLICREEGSFSTETYDTFAKLYERLSSNPAFHQLKTNVERVDKKAENHSPNFEALKIYLHQVETSIDSMGEFFNDNERDNFREEFTPYLGYLEIIRDAIEGIKRLNKIYANTVDTDKVSKELASNGKYHFKD